MQRSQWCSNRTCRKSCNLADLCTVHRGDQCDDYPGRWVLHCGSSELYASKDFGNTFEFAVKLGARNGDCDGYTICWRATEGDPRIGQVWFTGFYRHGTWNVFGQYVS